MDVLALFGWRTCRETPFKNSFSSASLPTRRSRAAMRASYSASTSAAAVSLSSPPASNLATQILIRLRPIPWRLARACSDSPPRNSWTTWRLNSIECVRCLAMGFLLESPVQLADSHLPHLSTPRGALHRDVRFSNRPSRVKHFQAIHHFSVDVAHGLALLFGLGTRALPSWDSKTRWNNLWRDLAVEVTAGSSGHTNLPHPSSRDGHHSTVGWILGFLLFDLILYSCHAAATSPVHRKSVPSTQMRCMITASRRASATMAFFMPRCLAIFIAHALSQDHFAARTSMLWAAS